MDEYLQAADDANRLLRGFAAVQTLADVFAKVGGLRQASNEAEARLATLSAQVEQAKGTLDALLAETDVAKADQRATQLLADAQARATEITAEADRKVAEARATCSGLATEAARLREQVAAIKRNAAASLGLNVA